MLTMELNETCTDAPQSLSSLREHYGDDLKILKKIQHYMHCLQRRYHPHMISTHYDLAMDLYLKWLHTGCADSYDVDLSSPSHYIRTAVRNFLISQERFVCAQKRGENHTISGETPCRGRMGSLQGDGDVTVMESVQGGNLDEETEEYITLQACMQRLEGRRVWGKTAISPISEEPVRLSHLTVVQHFLAGFTVREIAGMFSVSVTRVYDIYEQAVGIMRRAS